MQTTPISPDWIRNAVKQYFIDRSGISVDTVDIIDYFRVAISLSAVEDLINTGWLVRSNDVYPKIKRSGM
jgi:hypothetical protein